MYLSKWSNCRRERIIDIIGLVVAVVEVDLIVKVDAIVKADFIEKVDLERRSNWRTELKARLWTQNPDQNI